MVAFPGFAASLSGNYDASAAQIFGEAAYRLTQGPLRSEAFGQLAHVGIHNESFTETGNPLAALTVASRTTTATFSTLGLRARVPLAFGSVPMTGKASLGWQHAFNAGSPLALMAFAGSPVPFPIAGVPLAGDMLVAEAGIEALIRANMLLSFGYTGRVARNVGNHSVNSRLAVSF